MSDTHPIEVESYRILHQRVDLSTWPLGARQVVARMIHATADDYKTDPDGAAGDRIACGIISSESTVGRSTGK